ncbi:hypothetical protein [Clostridium thermobutyricum]|uniref:hypothetical protein n=1 Tax=Clostridium thermobutyricum TaxID=29372 RepID=UPI003F522259
MNIRKKVAVLQMTMYFGFLIAYVFAIQKYFSYMDFNIDYNFGRSLTMLILVIVLVTIGLTIKGGIWYSVWNIIFSYYGMGTFIYYQFNNIATYKIVVSQIILLMILYAFQFLNISVNKPRFNLENNKKVQYYLLFIVVFIIGIYYAKYSKFFNYRNIFLIDVYSTRTIFRNIDFGILGYLIAPLSRVVLPVLCVIFYEKKRYIPLGISIICILVLYLCGAVKSIFIGIIAIFIFLKGEYDKKIYIFLRLVNLLLYLGIIIYIITGNIFLLDGFIRRVFLIPPKLDNIYYNYFSGNHLNWVHTPIGRALGKDYIGKDLSMYVGENVMRLQGHNANVGIITEGFASFGYIGVIINSIIFALIFKVISIINLSSKYFGIIFVYIYYLNTAFIFPLILTHGLAFFIVFGFIFLSNKKKD